MSAAGSSENSQTIAEDGTIHFVEFINFPFVNITDTKVENESHIVMEDVNIDKNEIGEMHYLLENNEQNVDLDNQIIVIHDGKQFIFNGNQLNAKGEFILNSGNGLENLILSSTSDGAEYIMPDDTENNSIESSEITSIDDINEQEYQVVSENTINASKSLPVYLEELEENVDELNAKSSGKRKQYAVLRDGQLYIQDGEIDESQLYNTENVDDSVQFSDNLQDEIDESFNDDSVSATFGVAGRNLITGQTISLDSFITKMGASSTSNGILPVENKVTIKNSKKTEKKPKRIIGKIIAIKRPGEELNTVTNDKSISVPSVSIPAKSFEKPEFKATINAIIKPSGEIETDVDSYLQIETSNLLAQQEKNDIVHFISTEPMDDLVVKTLCGLMDMESFSKHLINKNMIIKNTFKRVSSVTNQCLYKEINYYKGCMRKTHTINDFNEIVEQWHFEQDTELSLDVADDPIGLGDYNGSGVTGQQSSNIDLNINETDTQQIDLTESEKGDEIDEQNSSAKKIIKKNANVSERVTVHVLIIEDEFGKKRTKVMIPKLNDTGKFCSICNKMFRNPQMYKRHVKTAHSSNDDKSNTCDLCNKKFCDASTLTRHRRIHNGDKNYQCNLCFKAFNTTGSLKRHITIHIPSLRPLQCLKCLQRFTDRSSLRKHMLLHTGLKPFQCDVCFKRFVHLGDLNFHRKIHDPSKQYTCETCGKEFNRHSNLLRHLDIHKDNGNVFKCDICGCCYNFMSSLTRHIVSHHMKDS